MSGLVQLRAAHSRPNERSSPTESQAGSAVLVSNSLELGQVMKVLGPRVP